MKFKKLIPNILIFSILIIFLLGSFRLLDFKIGSIILCYLISLYSLSMLLIEKRRKILFLCLTILLFIAGCILIFC